MNKKSKIEPARMNLLISPALKEKLEKLAIENHRSTNGQVMVIFEAFFNSPENQPKKRKPHGTNH